MDVNVKVTVDLGDRAMSLFNRLAATGAALTEVAGATKGSAEALAQMADAAEPVLAALEEPVPAQEAPKKEPSKRTPRAKAETQKTEPKEPAPVEGWEDMDDEARLELIKSEVTKHAKRGKSVDIREMLSHFNASRASELDPKDYEAFCRAISRYGAGDSLEDIFSTDKGAE